MKQRLNGMLELNMIRLILKPAVAEKLNIKPSTLEWFMCRADKQRDVFDLSGYGVPNVEKDSKNMYTFLPSEVQLQGIKLSEHKIVLNDILKSVSRRGFDMTKVKELHKLYFRVDYNNFECYTELFYVDNEGKRKTSPKLVSKF
jgi:hypothetical protein